MIKRYSKNERKAAGQRDSNRPQATTIVRDREVPSHRSPLPACKGQKELSAFVLPLSRTCSEDWPSRVVGLLAAPHSFSKGTHHPCCSDCLGNEARFAGISLRAGTLKKKARLAHTEVSYFGSIE
jgi:hypothetical protein